MDIKIDFGVGRVAAGSVQSRSDADTPHRADADRGVTQLQNHVQGLRRELNFRVDETTGVTVLRVVDMETGQLVRQIPCQGVLEMMNWVDRMQANSGLLLREQA
jgi:flagellar protein FlaG